MKKIAFIGSGDLVMQLITLALHTNEYEIIGCFDDFNLIGNDLGGYKILGNLNSIEDWYNSKKIEFLVIGIGYNRIDYRKKIYQRFNNKIPFANLIHKSAIIDPNAKLGKGVVVMAGCVLDIYCSIEDNVLLNIGTKIAHHSIVKAHSFLAPNVSIAGFTIVGESCILGISTTIIDNLSICNNVRTGASTTVIKNIVKSGLYIGTPSHLLISYE
jgi:sugar O-acyltransferase (sialic acid O-acetyltransferase NeuD family)